MKRILFACLVMSLVPVGAARADSILYGVTLTNLVIVNHNDPSQVTVVGPTGLGAQGMVRPMSLAYYPGDGYLYGIGYDAPTGVDRTFQYLFRIDRLTGAGSIVATLPGDPDGSAKIQGLEYVETLNSLVATRGFTDELMVMTTGGATTSLLRNGVTNNWIAFDSSSNVLFTVFMYNGPNSPYGQLWSTSPLVSGSTATYLGPLQYPLSADVAYNPDDGFIYGATGPWPSGYPFDLYRISASGYDRVGSLGGDALYGAAFAPEVPEPASLLLLGTGLVGAVRAVQKRRG